MRRIALVFLLLASPLHAEEEVDATPIASVVAQLKDLRTPVRQKAAFALWERRTETREHLSDLARALRDQDAYVRETVERVLSWWSPPRHLFALWETAPELIAAAADERVDVRRMAIGLIWNAGPPVRDVPKGVVATVGKLLKDPDAQIRARAAAVAWNLSGKTQALLDPVCKALADTDKDVRNWAPRAMGGLGPQHAIDEILALTRDEDAGVRNAATNALAGLPSFSRPGDRPWHERVGLGLLRVLREDTDVDVRANAASSLWVVRYMEAIPALSALALDDETPPLLRSSVIRTLGGLGGDAVLPTFHKLLAHKDANMRSQAAQAAGQIGPEASALGSALKDGLADTSAPVRSGSAYTLARMAFLVPGATDLCYRAIQDLDPGVRTMAASSLVSHAWTETPGSDHVSAVIHALHDDANRAATDPGTLASSYANYLLQILGASGYASEPLTHQILKRLAAISPDATTNDPQILWGTLAKVGARSPKVDEALETFTPNGVYQEASLLRARAALHSRAATRRTALVKLIGFLQDDATRAVALFSLRDLGPLAADAAGPLSAFLDDNALALQAACALVAIQGNKATQAVSLLRARLADPATYLGTVAQLREVGPAAGFLAPDIVAGLADRLPGDHSRIALALSFLENRTEPVLEALRGLVRSPFPHGRMAARAALHRLTR